MAGAHPIRIQEPVILLRSPTWVQGLSELSHPTAFPGHRQAGSWMGIAATTI